MAPLGGAKFRVLWQSVLSPIVHQVGTELGDHLIDGGIEQVPSSAHRHAHAVVYTSSTWLAHGFHARSQERVVAIRSTQFSRVSSNQTHRTPA
jgi:hypothetical protein